MEQIKNNHYKLSQVNKDLVVSSIFAPVEKSGGFRNRGYQEIEKPNLKIVLRAFEVLDSIEQSVLFTILAMASYKDYHVCYNNESCDVNENIVDKLIGELHTTVLNDKYFNIESVCFETTLYELMKESGMGTSQQARSRAKEALGRISSCTITVTELDEKNNDYEQSNKFISYMYDDSRGGKVSIAVNPAFVKAFEKNFTGIDLNERRQIGNKKQIACLLHTYLQNKVGAGKCVEFNVDRISSKIYSDDNAIVSHKKINDRRKALCRAFNTISSLEKWNVHKIGTGARTKFSVTRLF